MPGVEPSDKYSWNLFLKGHLCLQAVALEPRADTAVWCYRCIVASRLLCQPEMVCLWCNTAFARREGRFIKGVL